jgi:hypothetical protein
MSDKGRMCPVRENNGYSISHKESRQPSPAYQKVSSRLTIGKPDLRSVNIADPTIVTANPMDRRGAFSIMESKHVTNSATPKTAGSMGILLLLLGLLVILTLQPPSLLEPGSGMGNYWVPGTNHGGHGATPPTTTGPSSGSTPAGNPIPPPTIVLDVLAPINDTASNL